MLKEFVQGFLNRAGYALHRKGTVDRLLRENERLRGGLNGVVALSVTGSPAHANIQDECEWLRAELRKHEEHRVRYLTTEDYGASDKMKRIVDGISDFGHADFAELSCWIFASSLINHRVVHQRIDEGSMLWRAVKMSGGPILEVGRAAGGSTLVLLGASGSRPVVSIDRDPFHAPISEQIFHRADVSRRLKLYRQTSREPIPENEFGMMFIDADHSYEGICHDIATFWNQLKSFDGKPPLAAFHDAADNPINQVDAVMKACRELAAERGVARVVESWGSMLVLEKIGDLDQDRWYTKELSGFWKQYVTPEYPILKPKIVRGSMYPECVTPKLASVNLLGEKNNEDDSWIKHGINIERAQLDVGSDNPARLLCETPESGEHGIEKSIALNISRFNFSVFLRPHLLKTVRISILDKNRSPIAYADFELGAMSRIAKTFTQPGADIIDANFLYRNGYFGCNLAVGLPTILASATFAVNALDESGTGTTYLGNGVRGFFTNLSSVREIL